MKITEKEGYIEIDGVILREETIINLSAMQAHCNEDPEQYGPVGALGDVILFISSLLENLDGTQQNQAISKLIMLSYARARLLKISAPFYEE